MSARKSVAWVFVAQFAGLFIQFGCSIVIARLLSPGELGIFAIAMAAQAVVQTFVLFGSATYVVREKDLHPDVMATAFTLNAGIMIAIALVLAAVARFAQTILGSADAGRVLYLLCPLPLLNIFTFRASAMMQREMRFSVIAMADLATVAISSVGAVVFALLGATYMSPAYAVVLAALVSSSIYLVRGRGHHGLRLSRAHWRPMTVFGLRMMSIGGVATITQRLADIILGRLLGIASLGLFARASNLANIIFGGVYGSATRVVFAQLSKDFRETGRLRETFVRGLQLITGVLWPIQIGLAVLARPAIAILYGDRWLAAAAPLSIMMVGQFVVLSFGMNWELFVLRDESAKQTRYELLRNAAGLVTFTIGCFFSLEGAALGRLADALIGFVIYIPHVRRLADTRAGEIASVYRSSGLLTIAAVAPGLALMATYRWDAHVPITLLLGSVAMGGVLWLAALRWLGHPLWQEIQLLLARSSFTQRLARL